jgi:hypothetical protein
MLSWFLRMPGWVVILVGLAGFPVAYYEAERVEAGAQMSIVLLPFYKLAGKWGVFGVLSFGALLLIAIGVAKLKARRQAQPAPPTPR